MYQKSFLIRTSRIWNCLADELDLSSSTLASFKQVIFNYYKSALAVSYDCEDPHSFKSVCLKCNSARFLSRTTTCCMQLQFFFVSLRLLIFRVFFVFFFLLVAGPSTIGHSHCAVSLPTFFLFVCLFVCLFFGEANNNKKRKQFIAQSSRLSKKGN